MDVQCVEESEEENEGWRVECGRCGMAWERQPPVGAVDVCVDVSSSDSTTGRTKPPLMGSIRMASG